MVDRSIKHLIIAVVASAGIFTSSCRDDIWEQEKYQIPEWQEGKIFTQIQEEEDLQTFAFLLEATGYDTILNTSGSYTVFAPTNEAFDKFFQDYPEYRFLNDSTISSRELISLVEFQIIYNAWSEEQFQSLDVGGWIDPDDKFSEPKAFKRKTLLHESNKKYHTILKGNYFQIVDSTETNNFKIAYTASNKYSPIFFNEFFNVYDLTYDDYEYYFNRSYNLEKLYFAGAEFDTKIPAENGFIYKTDKVVTPLPNGEEILEKEYNTHSYKSFLRLIHQFAEFRTNLDATYDQPGADQGIELDTLYNLSYPDILFNIHNELTGNTSNSKYTIREHYGLFAPTDEALESFLSEYLSTWGKQDDLPLTIKRIIINSHMSSIPVYPTDMQKGFVNGEQDRVFIDESATIQRTFGSNCSFLGLSKAIVPRVITSVCRPVYLTRDYKTMMYALEATKVLSALKKTDSDFSFYLPSDQTIGLGGDSSLTVVIDDPLLNRYHFQAYEMGSARFFRVDNDYLRKMIFNQIGTSTPKGHANKEFIKNLAGNYIVVDHNNGTVSGTAPTTFGLSGDSIIDLIPEPYSDYTDNGKVYNVDTWFSFSKADYYGMFVSDYPEFLGLLSKAGLFDPRYYNFPFLVEGVPYTIFIPSSEALEDYRADTLSKDELVKFLKYHFVKGELIFTDGSLPSGYYTTCRVDESSTTAVTKQSTLNIKTNPDLIEILDKENNVYIEIPEEEGKTNRIVVYDSDESSDSNFDYITTAVVHGIDRVLKKDSLQAR